MWLCEHSDKDMKCFPSRKTLALECGISIRTLDRSIQELVELKLIAKSARYNNNEQSTNFYEVVLSAGGGDTAARGSVTESLGGDKKDTRWRQKRHTELNPSNSTHLTQVVSKDTTISSLYYQVIKSLDLPVRNHNSLKSKIKELEGSSEPEAIVKYLEFMRDYFRRATWDYKPSVVEGLDIYNKRKQIEESIKRAQNKPKKGIKV